MPENQRFIPTAVIRNRTSGGVGGRRGWDPASYPMRKCVRLDWRDALAV